MKKVLLLLLFSHTLLAQPTYHFDLLKDINSETGTPDIMYIRNVGNQAVFFHSDRDYNKGTEKLRLWKSDGTNLINFASSDLFGANTWYSEPTIIDNYIFFYVSNSAFNYGLYVAKLDSPIIKLVAKISAAPIVVKFNSKIYYGNTSQHEDGRLYYYNEITNESTEIQGANIDFFNPTNLKVVNNKLFFFALTGNPPPYKRQLWVSDGTNAGTNKAWYGSTYGNVAKMGNQIIYDGSENNKFSLFISDGTESGTYAFKSIQSFSPSTAAVTINDLYGFGNKTLILLDISSSYQFWVTDGTEENTKFLDYYEGIGLLDNGELATLDGSIFITNRAGQLIKTDGNTKTVLGSGFTGINKMVYNPVDKNLYFNISSKFYKTDGTIAGTILISDKISGPKQIPFTVVSNKIIAHTKPSKNAIYGSELYTISADTVKILKDLDSTTLSADMQFLLNKEGKSYFLANENSKTYQKIFETDGTVEGTRGVATEGSWIYGGCVNINNNVYLLKDNQIQKINFSSNSYDVIKTLPEVLSPYTSIVINNKFYFITVNQAPLRKKLWASDGTPNGTTIVRNFDELESFQHFAVYNQHLYLFTLSNNTTKIWRYDNDMLNPTLIKTINSYSVKRTYSNFRNKLAFLITTINGMELWETDGTNTGTKLIDFFSSVLNFTPDHIYLTEQFYYYSEYKDNRTKVWKSDGTASGTLLIADIAESNYDLIDICHCNNSIFMGFNKASSPDKSHLYKYNPATNATDFVSTTNSMDAYNFRKNFHCLDKQLYFIAYRNSNSLDKRMLYTSDGTSAGTKSILLLENRPLPYLYQRGGHIFPFNDKELLISVNDKFYDYEWFTFRKCDNPTNLSGTTADSKIQSSSTFLESTEKLDGDSRVYYFAPKSITLKPGFSVDNTNVFKAEIKNRPCSFRQ